MTDKTKPPQQHKQPSRKGKKAWRKNVDVSEVQVGLESLREEIIQGGPIAEKSSEDLFALDTVGSESISKTYKLRKPLKADEILAQRSAVRAIDSRKRPNSKITDGILEPSSKRQKQGWVSKKDVLRLKETAQGGSQLTAERIEDDTPAFDLWTEAPVAKIESKSILEYVPPKQPKVAPKSLREAPIPMTASGKPVRAVRDPAAGSSYNPTFEDWDVLITKEGEKEIEAEKKRRNRAMEEAEKEARIAAASVEDPAYNTDAESAWEGFETDKEEPKLKRPERKTQSQRNKFKRRKEAERQAKHEQRTADKKSQAKQIEEALKAGQIFKVAEDDNEQESSDSDDGARLRRRRLGTSTIPGKDLELVLPEELQESLRRLKPEGNLLNDRFRNLLVNGKLESRKPILQPKKAKRTYTEKWSYKDFSVSA